jgi:methylated-DNA-[protein]-cysteine S-methyltransferase
MTPLQTKTYELLKTVPKGRVTTYKLLAHKLGTKSYRAIGQFMKKNPYAPLVPCHRVVASDGSMGGFRGQKNGAEIENKIKMLSSEGVQVTNNHIVNFDKLVYNFS